MSSSYQPDYDRSLSPDSDLEVLDWPNISRPSGGRRRASCIERVGLPASKRTQNLVLYRSKDTQGKRLQQRQRSISYHVGAQSDKDETLEERPRNRSLSPAFSAPNLGQLNHLPLKCTPLVQRAVQYYTEVYARYVLQRPQYAGHGTDWGLLEKLVPLTMSDPMVLSSVVALMELVQNKGKQSATTLSKAVMRYATEAISQLQVKLVCEKDSLDDAVLIAMLNLAAMEFHENNFGRLNIHMQAITRIVELRGGVDRLGFDGYLGHTILAYTTLWQQMRLYHLHPPKVTIEYPTHPFSPEFCKHISDLPVGFQEPMLARQCCFTVIEILHNIFVSKIQVVTVAIPYETLGESIIEIRYLQQRPDLSVFERIILHGIIAFIIHSDNSKAMYRVLKPKFLQVQCQALLTQNKDLTAMHESQRQCLIWASCLFIAETQWGSWTSRLGTKLLANVADDMSWEKRLELCQDFFWNAGCTTELQWKIKHEGER